MRIGIIGLGSIGRQHARQLLKLDIRDIVALRTGMGSKQGLDTELQGIIEVNDEGEFFGLGLDGVIIANPTHLHLEFALKCISRNLPVLIEKPIEHTTGGYRQLSSGQDMIRVAYCMRFHKMIIKAKELISNQIGRLYKISFTRGHYLPDWHPYADYRTEYAAKSKMGGGAIRTLSHEIDLLNFYELGQVVGVSGCVDTVSDLELDTDDFAFFSCKLQNNARANFEIDFLNYMNTNKTVAVGSDGQIDYDLSAGKLRIIDRKLPTVVEISDDPELMFDDMYRDQMKDFLGFLHTGQSKNATLIEAYKVLKIVEQVKVEMK